MTTNQENTLLILRGDNFDRLFAKYYSYYDELHKAFHTPKFTVGDTNVPYRVINHWDQHGLLPAGFKKEGGWRLFSLVEMAWLQIILQMRKFGMSLDQIKKAKDGINIPRSSTRAKEPVQSAAFKSGNCSYKK